MPHSSRRSACDRCHALKSRCIFSPGSRSCERCRRLELVCQSNRAPRGQHTGNASGTAHYTHLYHTPYGPSRGYCTSPPQMSVRGRAHSIPWSNGRRQSLNHMPLDLGWSIPPEGYENELDHETWNSLDENAMLSGLRDAYTGGDLWALPSDQTTGPARGVLNSSIHHLTSVDLDMDIDLGLGPIAPETSILPLSDEDNISTPHVDIQSGTQAAHTSNASNSETGGPDHAAQEGADSTSPRSPAQCTEARTTSPRTGFRCLAPSPARSACSENDRGISQELLSLQTRLCESPAPNCRVALSDRLENLFKETEVLISIMSRYVGASSTELTHSIETPQSQSSQPSRHSSTYESTSAYKRGAGLSPALTEASPADKSVHADEKSPMTEPIMSLVFLTCYLCLLQQYDGILESLDLCLRGAGREPSHSGASRQGSRARAVDSCSPLDGNDASPAQLERGGRRGSEEPRDQYHLGRFQLFDSIHLNAGYIVPLIARMIQRMHTFIEKQLGPGAGGGESDGSAAFKSRSAPPVAGLVVHCATDMHRKVLDKVFLVEQAIMR